MSLNANDLEQIKSLIVDPMVEAVRSELGPLARTTYSNRTRIDKLEKKWGRALLGFGALTIALGVGLDWVRKKIGLVILLALVLMVGCATNAPTPTPHTFDTPNNLKDVSSGLTWIALLAVLGVAVGGYLMFQLPAFRGSAFVLGVSAAILAVALAVKSLLWAIPWVLGIGGVALVGFIAYEVWREVKTGHSVFDPLQGDKE